MGRKPIVGQKKKKTNKLKIIWEGKGFWIKLMLYSGVIVTFNSFSGDRDDIIQMSYAVSSSPGS